MMNDNMKMKDDVKKNHRRIIAKALYSEILEYLDAHSGETFSKEELMGFLLSYSASCEDDKLEKTRQNDSAGAAIKERFWSAGPIPIADDSIFLSQPDETDRPDFFRLKRLYADYFPESNTEAYLTALWNEHLDNPALMCSILANGVYAGYCGVGNVTEHPPEISIELLPEWTNRGIGSTALRTMLDAFSERLQICYFRVRIDPANVASQRLFEKLGAKPNGLSEFLIHGKEWLRQMEEENLTKIDDQLITVARKFNVEPRQLLSHVLEYKLHWDFRSAQEP